MTLSDEALAYIIEHIHTVEENQRKQLLVMNQILKNVNGKLSSIELLTEEEASRMKELERKVQADTSVGKKIIDRLREGTRSW